MKSVRAGARDVTAEVNRIFETDMKVETIRKRAGRLKKGGTIVPPKATAIVVENSTLDTTTSNNTKNRGNKSTLKDTPALVEKEIKKGK